ncbi:hypothetical protein NDU88_005335 [Pleurodeles waltl]|uniref:Uncharacterized protein n=1 Tax=Pleurodeles waltl TaxID=8319 RepID=A0AAV7MEB5_PLEWA|nr:hypothetical protein NDU88_005335 [Pleurodeles waltl]
MRDTKNKERTSPLDRQAWSRSRSLRSLNLVRGDPWGFHFLERIVSPKREVPLERYAATTIQRELASETVIVRVASKE